MSSIQVPIEDYFPIFQLPYSIEKLQDGEIKTFKIPIWRIYCSYLSNILINSEGEPLARIRIISQNLEGDESCPRTTGSFKVISHLSNGSKRVINAYLSGLAKIASAA